MNILQKPLSLSGRSALVCIHFFIALLCLNESMRAQNWTAVADFSGTARDDGAAFAVGNTAYFGTGFEVGFQYTRDFYAFHFTDESWSQVASLPPGMQRQYACAFSIGDYGYLCTGVGPGGLLNDLWRYDPANDSWEEMASLPVAGRSGAAVFVAAGSAYIVGGRLSPELLSAETWRYNPQDDSWQQLSDYPGGGVWRAGACTLGNAACVGFGLLQDGGYSNDLWSFFPSLNQWGSPLTSFPEEGRSFVSLLPYAGDLLAYGGLDAAGIYHNDLWRYDTGSFTWTLIDSLPAEGRKGGMLMPTADGFYYSTGITAQDERLTETWKWAEVAATSTLDSRKDVLFPNPTQKRFWLEGEHLPQSSTYQILGITGVVLAEGLWSKGQPIDCQILPKGLYLLRLSASSKPSTSGNALQWRFIIE